jgi:hypothetical protein
MQPKILRSAFITVPFPKETTMLLKMRIFGIAAIALTAMPWAGNESTENSFTKYHASYFSLGGTIIDRDNLNDALEASGYHGVKNYALQAGGGFNWQKHRLVGGLDLLGYIWRKGELSSNLTRLYGIGGRITTGVNVLPAGPALLYPMLGFGTGRLWMNLGKKEAAFADVVAAPVNEIKVWQRTVVLEPGIGFDYAFGHIGNGRKAVQAGIRAGYSFDLSDANDWRSDGVDITGGPDLRASGPYVRLIIGKRTARTYKAKGCCTKA